MSITVIPKVFISYSWDSEAHRVWVRDFATRLRSDGIESIIDQWEVAPGDQLTAFMERAVRESDFVLIVCTPNYKGRSDGRRGGAGYEGDVMTAEVYNLASRRKFIPLLRDAKWSEAAPSWLMGSVYIDLSGHPYPEDRYRQLLDTLHSRREKAPPVVPQSAGKTELSLMDAKTGGVLLRRRIDGITEVAQRIVDDIEREPRAWEIRLFGQVLADELQAASSLRHDLTLGVALGPFKHLDDDAAVGWMQQHMDGLATISSGLAHLVNNSLSKAMGPPGVPGNPESLVHVAKSVAAAYKAAIRWTLEWRNIRVSERFAEIARIGPRFTEDIIPEIEAWSVRIQDKVREAMTLDDNTTDSATIELGVTISIPKDAEEALHAELARLRSW